METLTPEKELSFNKTSKPSNTATNDNNHIIQLFNFDYNQKCTVIGTDEAGRGPAAGGVFASAVCFHKKSKELTKSLSILNDSKQLSKKNREYLYDIIKNETINSTVCIEVEEIERINILQASLKAMRIACQNVIDNLCDEKFMVLIDGNKLIKSFPYNQKYVIKGDSRSASIAAASILAKVTRDRYMEELDKKYPQYGWSHNAGYLTKEHLEAIDKYGLSEYHRPAFLKKHFEKQLSLF